MVKDREEEDLFESEAFTDKWQTYKYLTEPQSDIKKDITSDFILAKLNNASAPTPEPIIELVRDAYFSKKMLERYAKVGFRYNPNGKGGYIKNQDGTFKKFPLEEWEKKYIMNTALLNFNVYMIKIIMTVLMYRNIDKNILMEMITEKNRLNEEDERLKIENEEIGKRLKNNIKKGDKD